MMSRLWLSLALILIVQTGNSAYITDKLLAGFYASPDLSTPPLRALPNGTPMEVLEEKSGFSRVRLGDNSVGWVETRFITEEKPIKMLLLELQAKYASLKRQTENGSGVETSGAASATPSAVQFGLQNNPLRESIAEPSEAGEGQIRRENERLRERLRQIRELSGDLATDKRQSQPEAFHPWLLPLILLGLLLSFIAGIAFKNYRIARRAGLTGRGD